jgi:hypothetical protein
VSKWTLLGLTLAGCLGFAVPTEALVVSDVVQGSQTVAGQGCGGIGTATVRMPRKTLSAQVANPSVGDPAYSNNHKVARLDSIAVARDARGLFARFTAHGSDDVCANPANYAGGWNGFIDYYIDVRRRVQVYALTRCLRRPRARPRAIFVTCAGVRGPQLRLRQLRWRAWGGKLAQGRGRLSYNYCSPTCATSPWHGYRVRVKLSKAIGCGKWVYSRLRVTYVGAKPEGPRGFSIPLNCPS